MTAIDEQDKVFPPPRHIPSGNAQRPDPLGFGSASVVTVPPPLPLSLITTVPQVGDVVHKSFGHHGDFDGEIIAHDPDEELFQVQYTDGDQEELTLSEVLEVWIDSPCAPEEQGNDEGQGEPVSVGNHEEPVLAVQVPVALTSKTVTFKDTDSTSIGEQSSVTKASRRRDCRRLSPLSPVFTPVLQEVPGCPGPVFDLDSQCQDLVGCKFVCSLLGPCEVTHWDTDCGQRRICFTAADGGESHPESPPLAEH
jgi:hypothetical protein